MSRRRPRNVALGIAAILAILAAVALSGRPVLSMVDSSPKTLYSVGFARLPKDWKAFGGAWSVKGGALNSPDRAWSTLLAPYHVTGRRYAVEATMRLIHYRGLGIYKPNSFGILFRARPPASGHTRASGLGAGVFETISTGGQQYVAAIITNANDPALDNANFNYGDFDPSTHWHTYHLAVNGSSLVLDVDGKEIVNTAYSQFSGADRVGLFSATSQVQVRSFKVLSK